MEGAIAAYAFAAEAAPTPDNFFHLGHAYRQSGRFKTAEETYRKAIDLAPQSAEAHFYLAEALEASRDLKGAMLAFEEADTLGLSAARDQWSRLLSKLQHLIFPAHSDAFSDAGAIMEALVRQENDETYLRLANALEAAGSFDAAIYACGAALTHRADYPEAERLVRDIVEQRVLKEKRSFLMQAGRRHVFPDACGFQSLATDILETLCLRVGHAFRDTGMPVPAFAAYDAAAVYSPSADTFYHLGHACRRLGDHRRAIRSYACGLEKGETAPGYFYLGEALIASGLQAEGLAALTWALSIDPSFVDARRHIDHLQRQIVPPMRVQDLVVPIPKPLSVGMDGGLATLATDAFCLQPAGSFAWLQKGDGEEQDGVTLATLGSSAPPDANAVPSLGKGGLALQFSLLAPMRSRHVVKILLRQPSSSRIDVFDRSLPAEEQQLPIRRLRANETLEWICFDLIKPVNGSPHFIELKVLDTLPPDGRGDCLALFTHPLGRNDLWGAFLEQVDYDRQLLELRRLLRV
ncbi:Tetratricopeptide repeat-containing protein [Rhizobium sp. RU20A]|nr:Tetratricopeptide repeat-containing protein [Rhizobium sp. RU20A]